MIENTAVKDPWKLPTYTSPNSTLALISHLRQNIWIRKYSTLKIVLDYAFPLNDHGELKMNFAILNWKHYNLTENAKSVFQDQNFNLQQSN